MVLNIYKKQYMYIYLYIFCIFIQINSRNMTLIWQLKLIEINEINWTFKKKKKKKSIHNQIFK